MEDKRKDGELAVEAQTLRRLDSIQKDNESCDETLTRLLDNAVEDVPIEKILTDLRSRFGETANLNVAATPSFETPGTLIISVHTGDVGWEENVTLYEGKETRAVIESKAGEKFSLPFYIIATYDGPQADRIALTVVYMADNVIGAEPVTLGQLPRG